MLGSTFFAIEHCFCIALRLVCGLVRTTNPAQESNSIAPDMALYASERWGHFSYALPLPEGRYRVTLKFSEGHYGKRNTVTAGQAAASLTSTVTVSLSLGASISGGRQRGQPIDRSFSSIRPNAKGKIRLTFVPVKGMACVNGIEVVEDAR